jgi:N-acetylglucosamine-6-sulfatase
LILVDDLRWDSMSCAGNEVLQTPGFDRLAHEGTRFSDAFVTTSLCCPSRASIFSGLEPTEHGVRDIFTALADSVSIFPDRLRAAGYETAHIGKWHLNRYAQRDPAFERWVSFVTWVRYRDPELVVENSLMKFEGHLTDILTDQALQFLQQRRDRPFFLVLSHLAPHMPFEPQDKFAGRFDDAPVTLPANVGTPDAQKPAWLACRQARADWTDLRRDYYEMVAGVDESVAKVLAALDANGQLDDTLILLIGDNGYHLGEHGLGDKRTAYEESIRVPLLVRYPRWFEPGSVVSQNFALNLDVAATMLRAAGLAAEGLDLRQLADGSARREEFVYRYWSSPSEDAVARCTPNLRALRTLEHKWIETERDGEHFEELYDLRNDPLELENLAASGRPPQALIEALRLRLAAAR